MRYKDSESQHGAWLEKIIAFFLTSFFKFLGIDVTDLMFGNIVQFIQFGMVGVSNTVISYCIYALSVRLFQFKQWFPETGYLIAQIDAFFLSATWGYFWNNYFTFQEHQKRSAQEWITGLLKAYISYSFAGLGCSTVILYYLVGQLGLSPYVGQAINLMVGIPLNFLLNKLWVFRRQS